MEIERDVARVSARKLCIISRASCQHAVARGLFLPSVRSIAPAKSPSFAPMPPIQTHDRRMELPRRISNPQNALKLLWIAAFLLRSNLAIPVADSLAKCGSIGRPVNGFRRDNYVVRSSDQGFFVGSSVTFGCRLGYKLRGERDIECRESSTGDGRAEWSASLPRCVPYRRCK